MTVCPKCGADSIDDEPSESGTIVFGCGSDTGPRGFDQDKECRIRQLERLMREMRGWDQMHPNPMTGDHAFWRDQIDKVLENK